MNEANQPDELAILKANVAANPNNFDELLTLAEAYRQQQRYYDAIDTYKKAITLAPIDVDLHYSLGTIYESMGNIDEAKRIYAKATTIDPKYSKAYYKLGKIHEQHERIEEAIQAYEKCLKYSSDTDERLEVKEKLKQLTSSIPTTTGQSHLAYRLAAGVLLLGSLVNIVGFLLLPSVSSPIIFGAAIDIGLAIGMFQLRAGARNFTILRAVVGAILGPILMFINNDIITSAIIASVMLWGYCGSILLLLTGQTKTWRLILAMGVAVIVLGCDGLSTLLFFLSGLAEN